VSALKPDVALALWQLLTCKYSDLRDDTGGTSEVFRSGEFSLSSSGGALARRRSSSAGGSGKAERRTNAITDASFKKALEQFTKENQDIIQEQHDGPALGKDCGDSENEKDDDEKILQAVKALGEGGGGKSTLSANNNLSRTTRVNNVMREDDENDEKSTKRPTRTPSVGFAEPLEVERKSTTPDEKLSFNRNPWRTSLRNSKDRHAHDDIEDPPPPATPAGPQSRRVDRKNESQEKESLPVEDENMNEIRIDVMDMENEITASVVGVAEADESDVPLSPFENSHQPPVTKRRYSDELQRTMQEDLQAASSSTRSFDRSI
jgi:hypothetical protein